MPLLVTRAEYEEALRRLLRGMRRGGAPRETARGVMEAGLEGEWVAEVHRGRVYSLLPTEEGALSPEEAKALRGEYLGWCGARGGGDCMALLEDGPYLQAEDRRVLALAMALDGTLGETLHEVRRELLDPRVVVATLTWTAAMYLAMWLVPEPVSKAVAALLTLTLVAWMGWEGFWGLIDGWALLAKRAHEASTFAELREAGEQYAQVMGEQTGRVLVMGVGAALGGMAAQVARRVRALPGYARAAAQAEAQGVRMELLAEVESVAASSEGGLTVVRRGRQGGGGAGAAAPAPRRPSIVSVLRHRAGNLQVLLSNGQRWHLPRGRSPNEIPLKDPLGDELQAAANKWAKEWGPHQLKPGAKATIARARAQGREDLATRWEGQARGRWVEDQMREQFKHLKWHRQGVDAVDPMTGRKYEVLSGTDDNFGVHGRRMRDEVFRMIFF